MSVNLTVKWLDSKLGKTRETREDIQHKDRSGLGVRLHPSGAVTFYYAYRRADIRNRALRRVTLGQYGHGDGDMSLAEAREKAAELRARVRQGVDVAAVLKHEKRERMEADTFEALAKEYVERYAKGEKRSWREDERILNREFVAYWGDMKAQDITRGHVLARLDEIVDRGARVQANRALACLRKMYKWSLERGYVEHSPCEGLSAPGGKEQAKQRFLNETEVRTFWHALDSGSVTPAVRILVRLLLATGLRTSEVRLAEWSEVDFESGEWLIPGIHTKSGLPHLVPITPLIERLLREAKQQAGRSTYLFPGRTDKRPTLEETTVSQALRRMFRDGTLTTEPFTAHDLRRTVNTQLARLRVKLHVRSAILGHRPTNITDRVYNAYEYADEQREALAAWGEKIESIVAADDDKVVSLRA